MTNVQVLATVNPVIVATTSLLGPMGPTGPQGPPGVVNVQKWTVPGVYTWTKPANVTFVRFLVLSGGGGGASGQAVAAGVIGAGGAGGAGSSLSDWTILATELPATLSVTVGAGGAGGVASSGAINNGATGTASLLNASTNMIRGSTNQGGSGFSTPGQAVGGLYGGTTGGAGGNGVVGVSLPYFNNAIAAGGAGGGGVSAVGATFNGGNCSHPGLVWGATNWSSAAGVAPGGNGGDSPYPLTNMPSWSNPPAAGGGGGASNVNGPGGNGGNGFHGAGGGGGGAAQGTSVQSGAGGKGGDGWVIVMSW